MSTNRYTNITPSQFQPLSLQEIMLVPTLKRQQHDAALAGMEQLRDLQADPLKVHEERALQIKSDFENKINERVEQLNSQGYDPSVVSDLSRLNKEYKDLISPTGEIGKINQAKKVRNQMYDQWLKNKDYDKYGSDVMQGHWNRFEGDYTGFDSEGNITNIGAMSSPAYEDLDEDLKTRFKGLGHIATDILSGGVDFQEEADGSLSVYNTKTGSKTKINDPQIKAMIEDFRLKWVDPRGSGYKSLKFAGIDPNYALQRAGNVAGANIIRESGSTNITTGSRVEYKNTEDRIKGGFQAINRGTTFKPEDIVGDNKWTDVKTRVKDGTATPGEKELYNKYSEKLKNDPITKEYVTTLNNLTDKFNKERGYDPKNISTEQRQVMMGKVPTTVTDVYYTDNNGNKYLIESGDKVSRNEDNSTMGKAFRKAYLDFNNEADNLKINLSKRANELWKGHHIEMDEFYLDHFNSKGQAEIDKLNKNIGENITDPKVLESLMNSSSVVSATTSEGKSLGKSQGIKAYQEFSKQVLSGGLENVKHSIIPNNETGGSNVVIQYSTKDTNGDLVPQRIEFKVNRTRDDSGYRNIFGRVIQMWDRPELQNEYNAIERGTTQNYADDFNITYGNISSLGFNQQQQVISNIGTKVVDEIKNIQTYSPTLFERLISVQPGNTQEEKTQNYIESRIEEYIRDNEDQLIQF